MVQLSNDCFAFGGDMISLEEAHSLLRKKLSPVVKTTDIDIYDAIGFVIATDIMAVVNVPSSDNSAVDGYAINYNILKSGFDHKIIGRVPAGSTEMDFDTSGVVRIFTGAPIPNNFDTVYMQEDVSINDDNITLPDGQKQGANVRHKGEDIKVGDTIIAKGTKLTASHIGLIAGQGIKTLTVYEKLKVGFFSSGDELLEVGTNIDEIHSGLLFDSNRPMGLSLIKQSGFDAIDLGRAEDSVQSTTAILEKGCKTCDVVMSAGGMSVGEEDHIQAVLSTHNMDFWKVAIKPGRPVGFGMVDGTPFVGFPGNPVSVFVTYGLIGLLVLKILSGEENFELPRLPVKIGFDVKAKLGRREFFRVNLENVDGELVAMKAGAQGSGVLSSVVNANGLIEIFEEAEAVKTGDVVNYIPFTGLYS
ncbi:MAG: molybdopterin molybdotransferase MoeA [Alphaproteobacteria bacterium]